MPKIKTGISILEIPCFFKSHDICSKQEMPALISPGQMLCENNLNTGVNKVEVMENCHFGVGITYHKSILAELDFEDVFTSIYKMDVKKIIRRKAWFSVNSRRLTRRRKPFSQK